MNPKNAFNPAYNPVDGEWSKAGPIKSYSDLSKSSEMVFA